MLCATIHYTEESNFVLRYACVPKVTANAWWWRCCALIIIRIIMCAKNGSHWIERVHFGDTFFDARNLFMLQFRFLFFSSILSQGARVHLHRSLWENVKFRWQQSSSLHHHQTNEAKYQFFNISILIYLAVTFSIHTWSPFSDTTNDNDDDDKHRQNRTQSRARQQTKMKNKNCEKKSF